MPDNKGFNMGTRRGVNFSPSKTNVNLSQTQEVRQTNHNFRKVFSFLPPAALVIVIILMLLAIYIANTGSF